MQFGITLANRGVLLGLTTVRDLLAMADAVEADPRFDSVWVGDALFVNRRLDAFTLLAAIAGRTDRLLLGPACMGSFALRDPRVFAYEWASLDVLSGGRTRPVGVRGRRRRAAVAGGNRGDGHPAGGTAQADDREHRRAPPLVDAGQRVVPRRLPALRRRDAGAEAGAVTLPDLADHQCRAPGEWPGGCRWVRLRAAPRGADRRWLDDALGQSGGFRPVLAGDPARRGRSRPRYGRVRQRALPPCEHRRDHRRGAGRCQALPGPVLQRQLRPRSAGGLGRVRSAGGGGGTARGVRGQRLPAHHAAAGHDGGRDDPVPAR